MRFEQPWWLILIPLAVAGCYWAYVFTEPKRAALSFPRSGMLARSAAGGKFNRILPYALKTLALILCIVAMARPQSVVHQEDSMAQGIDIMLLLDTSTSMRALFDPTDRISAAKETAKRFIAGRVHDRIGVIVFGGSPVMTCPLTMDYVSLLEFLDSIQAGMTETDGTAIGDAIASAADHLRSSTAKSKVIILMTDGANNTGLIDPQTAAKVAGSFGIKIYTIGTAKRGESLVPVDTQFGKTMVKIPDDLNEDELLAIANATDGRYFRATNFTELSSIYSEIDKLEKSDVGRPPILSHTDHFAWALVPAIFLLLATMALSETLLVRIP